MWKEIPKVKKWLINWWLVATVVLGVTYSLTIGDAWQVSFLTLAGSATVLALILFETNVHMSLMLLFISELCNMLSDDVLYINAEFALSVLGLFTGLYLVIKSLKTSGKKISVRSILTEHVKPLEVNKWSRLILLSLLIVTVFSLGAEHMPKYGPVVSLMAAMFTILPVLSMLFSAIPCKDVAYLRVLNYIMGIQFAIVASDGLGAGVAIAAATPSVVYLASVVAGRVHSGYYGKRSLKLEK